MLISAERIAYRSEGSILAASPKDASPELCRRSLIETLPASTSREGALSQYIRDERRERSRWLRIGSGVREPISPIAVVTLDGKAYYRITSLLREIGLSYRSLPPGNKLPKEIGIAITTKREASLVRGASIITLEEVSESSALRQRIVQTLYPMKGGVLTIGVDPGSRIGVAGFYGPQEIYSGVHTSSDDAIQMIRRLLEFNPQSEKIVRIGNGSLRVALEIARGLFDSSAGDVRIEMVDESGTSSSPKMRPNRRGARDVRSAGMIAFREGSRFFKR